MARSGSLGVRIMSGLWSRCGAVAARRRGAERHREPARAFTFEALEGRVVPVTITVLNTNDSGPDSLRAAIDQANTMPGPDTIAFAPSVTGTITLSSALPDLSTAIAIQGPGPNALAVTHGATPGFAFRIFNVTAGADVAISGLAITGGSPLTNAGGIANAGTLTVIDVLFSDNMGGGGIANSGTLTVTNSTFSGNSAPGSGGGINNTGTATVTGSTFSRNTATFSGGGIYNTGTLIVTSSTLSGNSSISFGVGGGILNGGTLTVTNSTLSGNSASFDGGGIANGGTLTVTNSTLSGNSALMRGGAIINSGTVIATNSTLSGNSAQDGGGIYNSGVMVTIADSTLSGNAASGSGGGIDSVIGTVIATNSLFANSKGGNLVIGTIFDSGGHNLFSDAPGVALDPTDLTNTDPLLGPLADNGGPTLTQALLPGSPAIDAGVAVPGVTTDQRGIPRPQGSAPDIGAFESRGFTLAVVGGDSQQVSAGSTFPAPLAVRVASPFGEPVAGGRVTFAAPSSGASTILSSNLATIDANGQAAVTATANGIGGTYSVTVRAAGATDIALTLTNLGSSIALTPPTVVSLQRFGVHLRPTVLVLTFSEPMDPTRAEALGNYTLVALGHGLGRVIPLVVANYDASAQTVTLVPSQLLTLNRVYQLTVNGMAPLGLTNTAGVLLDGRGNGQPGTNFVALIDRWGAVLPPVHHGKGAEGFRRGKPLLTSQPRASLSALRAHALRLKGLSPQVIGGGLLGAG